MKKILYWLFTLVLLLIFGGVIFTICNNLKKSDFSLDYDSCVINDIKYGSINSNNDFKVVVSDSAYSYLSLYSVEIVSNDLSFYINNIKTNLTDIEDYSSVFNISKFSNYFVIHFDKTLYQYVYDFYSQSNSNLSIVGLENKSVYDYFKIKVFNHDKSKNALINFISAYDIALNESEVIL